MGVVVCFVFGLWEVSGVRFGQGEVKTSALVGFLLFFVVFLLVSVDFYVFFLRLLSISNSYHRLSYYRGSGCIWVGG